MNDIFNGLAMFVLCCTLYFAGWGAAREEQKYNLGRRKLSLKASKILFVGMTGEFTLNLIIYQICILILSVVTIIIFLISFMSATLDRASILRIYRLSAGGVATFLLMPSVIRFRIHEDKRDKSYRRSRQKKSDWC